MTPWKHAAIAMALGYAALSGGPAQAQQTVILDVCQDGFAPALEAEMAQFLAGPWTMTAIGTGFTTGVNKMAVSLRYDAGSGRLTMGGAGGSVPLVPLRYKVQDDGSEKHDAPHDMSIGGLSPSGMDKLDAQVLTGCDDPTRYWWQMGSGSQKSWGGLMFFSNDAATGFMANSAGGTRWVRLSR